MGKCFGSIAASIALECATPLEPGYTGRNVLIPYSVNPTLTIDTSNKRILSAVSVASGVKLIEVENLGTTPHSGSTTTGNSDAGRPRYTKIHTVLIPMRGADVSADIIEPMVSDPQGFLLISEKKDKRGIGSYEVKGLQSPLKVDPTTVSRDEDANGGSYSLTLTCTEDWAECSFFATDYATTKAAFEDLLAKCYGRAGE